RLRKAAQELMHPGLDKTLELTISLGGSTLLPAESAGSSVEPPRLIVNSRVLSSPGCISS
ncbi:hypothetical protein QCD79_34650, partial [Pseudomonas quasicaspiana]|nr:hypothetical protein [Pseudomonas quasicaspiana]